MYVYPNNDAGYVHGTLNSMYGGYLVNANNDNAAIQVDVLLESANIYYTANNGTTTSGLVCLGWTDRVNAA